jgi:hypothetical protein
MDSVGELEDSQNASPDPSADHAAWLIDEEALAIMWERGRIAWRDVPNASDWVERLRGNLPG